MLSARVRVSCQVRGARVLCEISVSGLIINSRLSNKLV
jgi:hypothetical protein